MSKLADPYLHQYQRPTLFVSTADSQHHKLHLRAKINGNGPILMEIRSGEVRFCDGKIRCQNSPSCNSINIGPYLPYLHQNIEDDLVYHRANWDSDMTFLFTLFHSNSRTLWTGMSIRHHATSEVERYRSRGRKGSGPLRAELILWGVFEILRWR
jgi:hypothetical protein